MGESEWILPLLGIGGLAIGAIMVLPNFMKEKNGNGGPTVIDDTGYYDMLEENRRARRRQYDRDFDDPYTFGNRLPLIVGSPDKDDSAYIITDEDFDKLDIGKKDKKYLNKQRKIKDARLERVVYGDNMPYTVPSYFVNTVSPYGQGPAHEFTRLPGGEDLSKTNTRTNTINLY